MSHSTNIPLHLFQVLEEEFVNLHGPDAKLSSVTVELSDPKKHESVRSVVADLNWLFNSTHIKNAPAFAAEILRFAKPQGRVEADKRATTAHTSDWVKENLAAYITRNVDMENLARLRDVNNVNSETSEQLDLSIQTLIKDLNRLLTDSHLYRSDRFSSNWLGTASRSLITQYSSPETFSGDDLLHFNRLLLEDAFPKYIERINNIRLAAMYQRLHQVQPKALCLSGGGIRSGTFSLGILQGMARHNLLDQFNYLSTVSGGGYIGSWLSAWIHRHAQGLKGVTSELANTRPKTKIDPDPSPIRYLRKYSNFITPKVGLLSADTWSFIGIYLRNLFLNWLVFIPLIVAVLMLPRLIVTATLAQPAPEEQIHRVIILFGVTLDLYGRHIFLALGWLLGVWSLAYMVFNRPGLREELRQRSNFWLSRSTQQGFIVYCLLPLVGSAFCLTTYWSWTTEAKLPKVLPLFIIFGGLFTFSGWLIASLILGRIFNSQNRKNISWSDLVKLVFAGLIGGAILWLISQLHELGSPVIGYGEFAWDKWTTWTKWTTEIYACFAVPAFLLVFLLGATCFIGFTSMNPTVDDEDREWWARSGAWVLIAIISWVAATAVVIFGPLLLLSFPRLLVSVGGVSGLLAILVGRSSKTPSTEQSATQKRANKPSLVASLMSKALPVLALIFIAAFLSMLSLLTSGLFQGIALLTRDYFGNTFNEWLTNAPSFTDFIEYIYGQAKAPSWFEGEKIIHMNVLHHSSTWFVLGLGLSLFLFGMLLSRAINLNLFSLHAGYRNRLIRAFLGASRPDHERRPNPFTGFDPADNLNMHELRPVLFDEADLIDPVGIASALRDKNNPLTRYLSDRQLLNNINSLPSISTPSPRLIATLRKDLNGVLQDSDLYKQKFATGLLESSDNSAARNALSQQLAVDAAQTDGLPKNDVNILLNRAVLELAYPHMIRDRPWQPGTFKLMPVINTTLNLVGGENLAWQQRKAEPFSITPLHCGCFRLGYRSSREYGGSDTGGISLGTAATISGAAASSNMGYYTTSPLISLVLTLFNVRLGWWLGNPGPAGEETYHLRAPKFSVAPVIDEALGMTDDTNKYVYLTDGGHFENLAIYEMVLRRCHIVVACDGAQDPDYHFTDLGNAIRKIRIDLGIPIEFFGMPIHGGWPDNQNPGMYWAIAKIRYSCIDGKNAKDGVLLYIKPALYGNEPGDVLEYKKSFHAFPHQTTADQFFDEPQFESYRILGSHIMDQMCGSDSNDLSLLKMIRKAVNKGLAFDQDNDEFQHWSDVWLTRDK